MGKLIWSLFLFLGFITSRLDGEIIHAPNLYIFEEALATADETTLVLFDVDETLIIPKEHILRPGGFKVRQKYIEEISNAPLIPQVKCSHTYIQSLINSRQEYELVNNRIVEIIHSLQERNIKAIAFTLMGIGEMGVIPSLEDWRIKHLKEHQIDFSGSFPEFELILLNKSQTTDRAALFKKGVLCTNLQPKGGVLIHFLDTIGYKPKKILFIDNNKEYLHSVENALEGRDIEFIGFHYTEAEERDCLIDEALVDYQFMHLAQHHQWLRDGEVKELLHN